MKRTVYQTVADRDNSDYVQQNGPFKCSRKNAWLGEGYYYWDSFIENAHWWGEVGYKSNYIICESTYFLDPNKCFNLVDNPTHLKDFRQIIQLLKEKGLYVENETTVTRVIEFLKNTLKIFPYEGTRVYGVNSISPSSSFANRVPFLSNQNQYLDVTPAIQMCFYTKGGLQLNGYKIVYPAKYLDEYVV